MRVLLVEDDRMVGAAIAQALKDAAYAVDWVTDGESALLAATTNDYQLVLLDLGLPKPDGLDVLRQFRKSPASIPIIIVTARDGVDDRIDGLDLGADDYLIKPFEVGELLGSHAKRSSAAKEAARPPCFSNGTIRLDPATHDASHGEVTSHLTAREFAVLNALLLKPGTILSRAELETQVYGWNEEVESNAVEFLIHAIRKKLGAETIRNVRGVGWMVDRATS